MSQTDSERDARRAKRAARRQKVAALEKPLTRVTVGMVIAAPVLALGAAMLGAAEVFPYEYAIPVALTAALVPIGLALLIGACFGFYLIGGGALVPFAFTFVAGFGLLVYGLVQGVPLIRDIGVGLLALTGAVIYGAGASAGTAPRSALNRWGHPAAILTGSGLAILGHRFDRWPVLLFGAMAAACGLGAVLGRWWVAQRSQDDPTAS